MTKQTTTIAAMLAVTLGLAWMALPTFVLQQSVGPDPIAQAPDPLEPWADPTSGSSHPNTGSADSDSGLALRFTETPVRRRDPQFGSARSVTRSKIEIFCDRASMTLIGETLRGHLNCELRRATHRNVIEHVLSDTAKIGFVTVEPSANERRLGVRDFVLGQFEPVVVIARNNPWQMLRRSELQTILSGREQTWPGSTHRVEVAGPAPGNLTDLFAEVLIPGDRLTTTATFSRGADALASIKDRIHAVAIVTRPELALANAHGAFSFRELHIDGIRPSRSVYVVFRDQYDPVYARVLEFCRSEEGRVALGRVLTLR